MQKDEMHSILAEHLAGFRSWSYSQLAQWIEEGHREHREGVASDGTPYQLEFQPFWDDKPNGNIRVIGDLSAEPQKPLWGFIPIYRPDAVDDFIMSPEGEFIGETEPPHDPTPPNNQTEAE